MMDVKWSDKKKKKNFALKIGKYRKWFQRVVRMAAQRGCEDSSRDIKDLSGCLPVLHTVAKLL